MHKDLIQSNFDLADTVTSHGGGDEKLFLASVSKMLQWLPEDRKTAKKPLEDP